MCRAFFPLAVSHVTSGEFTFLYRLRSAVIDNLVFYGLVAIPGLALFLLILFSTAGGQLYVYVLLLMLTVKYQGCWFRYDFGQLLGSHYADYLPRCRYCRHSSSTMETF